MKKHIVTLLILLITLGIGNAAIEINNWHELNEIRNNLDGEYVLINDLDENTEGYMDYNDPETEGWKPIGNSSNPFSGSFDGEEHAITGLYTNRSGENYIGLFGYVYEGEIKNLNISEISIRGNAVVGGIAGAIYISSIKNCFASGNITAEGNQVGGLLGASGGSDDEIIDCGANVDVYSNQNFIGGLIGENWGQISRSFAKGNLFGNSEDSYYVGGLIGWNGDSIITDSYARGNATGYSQVGGLIGYSADAVISRSYSTGRPLGDQWVGGLIGYNQTNVSSSFWDTNTSEKTSGVGGGNTEGIMGKTTSEMQDITTFHEENWQIREETEYFNEVWHIDHDNDYPDIGRQPFEIYNWENLDAVRNRLDAHYILMNNLTPETEGYDEYASENANEDRGWKPVGRFSHAEEVEFLGKFDGQNNTISRFIITNKTIGEFDVDYNRGGLFGYSDEGSLIKNLRIKDSEITSDGPAGLLVGRTRGNIENCHVSGDIIGEGDFQVYFGGLAGVSNGEIIDSSADVYIEGKGQNGYHGGLVGLFSGDKIENSYALGDIKITEGGLVGGLVGGHTGFGNITRSYAKNNVSGVDEVGGLAGRNEWGTIKESYSKSNVYVTSNKSWTAGGLAGWSGGSIKNSYSRGKVILLEGEIYSVGGLLGTFYGDLIENSYSMSQIEGEIENASKIGSLLGEYSGGTNSEVKNSFALEQDFGLIGYLGDGDLINSYSLNTSEMMYPNTYSGKYGVYWNFLEVWDIEEGDYPFHRAVPLESPYPVTNLLYLTQIRHDLEGEFLLTEDIDVSSTQEWNWNNTTGEYEGWEPIENFNGGLDGQGHTISDLYINRPNKVYQSLFADSGSGKPEFENLKLLNVDITGSAGVSGLLSNYGDVNVRNVKVTGQLNNVGDGYCTAFITSCTWGDEAIFENVSAEGKINATGGQPWGIAGLIGAGMNIKLNNSYSDVEISASNMGNNTWWDIGGLVGYFEGSKIERSFSKGKINVDIPAEVTESEGHGIGGLVGSFWSGNEENLTKDSYSTMNITIEGNMNTLPVGGLVGYNGAEELEITKAYYAGELDSSLGEEVTGAVIGNTTEGYDSSRVQNTFWNTNTTGIQTGEFGTGKTTAEMKNITTYNDTATEGLSEAWDIWVTHTDLNEGHPFFSWQIGNSPTWLIYEESMEYELFVNISGGGEGNVTVTWNEQEEVVENESTFTIEKGTEVTLTAQPSEESKFGQWEDDCSEEETSICILNMTGNKEAKAIFLHETVPTTVQPTPAPGLNFITVIMMFLAAMGIYFYKEKR